MRDLTAELKALRLYGMAEAWIELEHGTGVETSRWLLEHLLLAEATDRAMRSVRYQITSAISNTMPIIDAHQNTVRNHGMPVT